MNETMKAFFEHINQNQELKEELDALTKAYTGGEQTEHSKNEILDKTIEIAARYGFALTVKDIPGTSAQLSEEQLFAATGGTGGESVLGGFCGCLVGGYGGGLGNTGEGWCMCVDAGVGYDGTKYGFQPGPDYCWCWCPMVGGGGTGPEG